MGKIEKKDGKGAATQMMQLFLKVSGGELPQLVMQPVKKDSYPANLVILPGCVAEIKEEFDENDAWTACGKVSELCRYGQKLVSDGAKTTALYDHLSDAYEIIEDLMVLMADEANIGCKSIYALASRIREFVVMAGKCVDLNLESTGE